MHVTYQEEQLPIFCPNSHFFTRPGKLINLKFHILTNVLWVLWVRAYEYSGNIGIDFRHDKS